MRMSIRTKIIIANLLVILPLLVVLNVLIVSAFEQYNLRTVRNRLLQATQTVQLEVSRHLSELPEPSGSDLHFLNKEISQRVGSPTQLFYIKNNRNILVDSRTGNIEYNSATAASDEGFQVAISEGGNYILKDSGGMRYFEVSFPIYHVVELVGSGRIVYSLEQEYALISGLRKILLSLSGLFFILIMSLLYALTNRLVSPLIQLKNSITQFDINHPGTLLNFERADEEVFQLSRSFNQMAENIRDLVRKLSDEKVKQKTFYDNMTHELKTPLTTIMGCADLACRVDSPEKREQCLSTIQSECGRLLRIVNQLLHQSRINEYESRVEKKRLDLGEVVAEAVKILQYKAKKNHIALSLTRPKQPIMGYIDGDKITELVLNLVDNAIKHSGTDKVEVALRVQENHVLLDVIDYGQGFQIGVSTKQKDDMFESQGIGLNICRQIVEQHGGSMYILPQQVGTIVRVQLPQAADAATGHNFSVDGLLE